jgi:predicted transcriptional regulator of viral defense system
MSTANDRKATPGERLLEAFSRRGGLLTKRDISALGFGSATLQQVLRAGTVVRAAHGLYRLADVVPFGTSAFAQACLAVPSGVIALQSALSYYELTTEIVADVFLAVPRNVARRRAEIPIRIVRMPISRFAWHVQNMRSENGDRFRIFSRERSVCDCFSFAKLVSESVAYEGLRNYLASPDADVNALMQQAVFTKTDNIIGPAVKTHLA